MMKEGATGGHEGLGILALASSPVVSVAEDAAIKDAVQVMAEKGFRRLPVVGREHMKVVGIITATDVLDYLGGGPKHELMASKHGDDLAAALSEPVLSIATREVVCAKLDDKLEKAITLMVEARVGGLPVVDEEGRLWAILTERDVVKALAGRLTGAKVAELMTPEPVVIGPDAAVLEAMRTMVSKGFRRLPVVGGPGELLGIITSMDVIRLLDRAVREGGLGPGVLKARVLDVCAREVVVVGPDEDVGKAAELMEQHGIGGLPVVEPGTGRLVGIITERDFFKLLQR